MVKIVLALVHMAPVAPGGSGKDEVERFLPFQSLFESGRTVVAPLDEMEKLLRALPGVLLRSRCGKQQQRQQDDGERPHRTTKVPFIVLWPKPQ